MKQRFAMLLVLLVATWFVASASARTDDATFTKKPTAMVTKEGVVIRFGASRATDVAVFVEDGKGNVVRHLVAGRLGKNPPPPLQADALEQTVVWDGKDDLGRPVGTELTSFRVRVGLGLTPTFERLIGQNPRDLGSIRGLAPGPDGRLYVFHCYAGGHPNDGTTAVAVLDRDGRYVRTVVPWPADMAEEKLKGLRTLKLDDGSRVPFVYQYETRSCVPGLGDLPSERPVVTRDGRLAFIGIQEGPRCFAQPGEARLTVLHTDGSVPPEGVLKTLIHPLTDAAGGLALSPDERTIYATGFRAGLHPVTPSPAFLCDNCDHGGATWNHTVPIPAVYQFTWDAAQVRMFLGDLGKLHEGEPKLKEPVSVATDKDGNVYVADAAAGQVFVCKADGSRLGEIAVAAPQRVEVSRKTGAVYVLVGEKKVELVKYDGFEKGREVARVLVGESRYGHPPTRRPLLALDESAEPPALWVSPPFLRIEDRGKSFGAPVDLRASDRIGEPAMAAVMEMSVDRVHGWLYVNNRRRYDVRTWAMTEFKTAGGGMWPTSTPGSANGSAGRDGNYYVNLGAKEGRVIRHGPDLKPVPFKVAEDVEGRLRGFCKDRGCGLTADAQGNVYVVWKKCGPLVKEDDAHRARAVTKYAPDGHVLAQALVDAQIPGVSSVRVDFAGNVYLAVALRPGKETVPAELKGKVWEGASDPDCVNRVNSYPVIYGSVVKFGPDGGEIRNGIGGVACNYAYGSPIEVKGAKWIFPGASVAGSWSTPKLKPGTTIVCMCESPCIDVDGFGRSFFPDAGRARVGVVDTAGNEVGWFGSYGNADSAGAGSLVPMPAIPLWWPQAVAADDGHVYVGDRLNRRVVVVRLGYRAEEVCGVR